MSGTTFAGRTAIVTGASRGIGLEVASRIVDEGGKVCVTARNAGALAEAVESLGGAQHAIGVPGKADHSEHQADAVARTLEAFGSLDVLVNNTGINLVAGPLLGVEISAARKVMEVNVIAALAWVQQAHQGWMRDHGGCVVNVASVAGLAPAADIGFYGASKAALIHLTRQLALELAPAVRVNAVAPAVVRTRFATRLYEGHEDEVVARYPLGRLGVPQDVAGAVCFLASNEASWVTGQVLVLDGGLTLGGGV
jgi:NAD(P)-dependent dehydrogenase (short-subunit alcohol dehydrogenase family)